MKVLRSLLETVLFSERVYRRLQIYLFIYLFIGLLCSALLALWFFGMLESQQKHEF